MKHSFRPPAVPLVTVDPFFSIWSFSDTLHGDVTRHWTGAPQGLLGLIRVDGLPYRFMGLETEDRSLGLGELPVMTQTERVVTATQTRYSFEAAGIGLDILFLSPVLMDDLDLASRPVNYMTVEAYSRDGKAHDISLYCDMSAALCCDDPEHADLTGSLYELDGLKGVRVTNQAQDSLPLASSGDNQRINWGYACLLSCDPDAKCAVASERLRALFSASGSIDPKRIDEIRHRKGESEALVGAVSCHMNVGTGNGRHSNVFLLAYDDDGASIDYFGSRRPAYCFRDGIGFDQVIQQAAVDYPSVLRRCQLLDTRLEAESERAGGAAYAALTMLAYRQAFAAHKLIADENGDVVFLSKECFSNGCIGTVDVSYPSIPVFLLYNPELVRGMLRPIFRFAMSDAWPFDFAPHDVGQYPLATGQVYGKRDGQYSITYQMPVEECGNMLIMTAAACRSDHDYTIASDHIDVLRQWADYLIHYGEDPGEQLCTDDFAGHLAHNTNLAIKAIVGLGAFSQLLEQCDRKDEADEIYEKAKMMAESWERRADDQGHTRLTFDTPKTWSMKYNLLFDSLLGLNLFSKEMIESDIAYWTSRQNRYGLPLDSRATYTKADWLVWCAALSEDPVVRQKLIQPLYRYYDETGSRVPMTDWYDTVTGRAIHFRNRSVIGGLFALLLKDKGL